MAKLPQTLIPILFLLTLAATGRAQSTSFAYNFSGPQSYGLIYQGNVGFAPDTGFLRLTEALPAQVGRVLHPNPIRFWQAGAQADFETTIDFLITPDANIAPGHGIAFFIAPIGSTIPPGSNGANLGIFDSNGNGNGVFAVEFDTVFSAWHRTLPHIGINLGSLNSVNKTTVGNTIIGERVTATISYDAATKEIRAVVSTSSEQTFEVSYKYDLTNLLNQQVQVGLSAATGQLLAKHDIVSWNFKASMVYNSDDAKTWKHLDNVIQHFV